MGRDWLGLVANYAIPPSGGSRCVLAVPSEWSERFERSERFNLVRPAQPGISPGTMRVSVTDRGHTQTGATAPQHRVSIILASQAQCLTMRNREAFVMFERTSWPTALPLCRVDRPTPTKEPAI